MLVLGVSLALLMLLLVSCFSYTPHASFSEVFFIHASFTERGVSVTHLMLLLVRCLSYTPHASFSEVFLLYTSCPF